MIALLNELFNVLTKFFKQIQKEQYSRGWLLQKNIDCVYPGVVEEPKLFIKHNFQNIRFSEPTA